MKTFVGIILMIISLTIALLIDRPSFYRKALKYTKKYYTEKTYPRYKHIMFGAKFILKYYDYYFFLEYISINCLLAILFIRGFVFIL